MTIKKIININARPTLEQEKMLEELKTRPIEFDDTCPEYTRVQREEQNKQEE